MKHFSYVAGSFLLFAIPSACGGIVDTSVSNGGNRAPSGSGTTDDGPGGESTAGSTGSGSAPSSSSSGSSNEGAAGPHAARCAVLAQEHDNLVADPQYLACTFDADCQLRRNGLCHWTGYVALNPAGATRKDNLSNEALALECSKDCGTGGAREAYPKCDQGLCVAITP